jgi:hypothetical protein
MIAVPTPMTDPAEPHDDADGELPFADWLGSLTDHAHEALVAAQQPQPARPAASLHALDQDSVGPLSQLVAMIAEVRDILLSQRVTRDYYSTEQAAQILGKANWTVREWCRQGRVHAEKRRSGRGRSLDWVISNAELQRIQKEGLLPAVLRAAKD